MKIFAHRLAYIGFLAAAVLAFLFLVPQLFASQFDIEWGSVAPDTTHGVYDHTNTTVLATGDIVQFIWAGSDGQIDPPNYDGTPSGDDILLATNVISNALPSSFANKGLVPFTLHAYELIDPEAGGVVYMRAWDHPVAGGYNGATYYGESETAVLENTEAQVFNAPRWHTDKSATLPKIVVAQGGTPLTNGQSNVAYGTTSQNSPITYTYTITNMGVDPLILTPPISVPTGFVVAQTFGTTSVGSLSSTTFQVALTAAAPGSFSGAVSFAHNDADETPFTFTVSGTVIAPEIGVTDAGSNVPNDGSVNYGTTHLPTPITKTFTISNTGTAALELSNLTVPLGFTVISGFANPTIVPIGSAVTIQVRLNAAAPGMYSGPLSFVTNDPDENPYTFTISGNVVTPEIEVREGNNPLTSGVSTVDYGTVMGGSPVAKTYTISNTGTADLLLSNLVVPTGYSTTALPSPIAPGQSGLLTITLTANNWGVFNGTVQFTTNDLDENPFTFGVTGAVVAPEIEVRDGATNILDNTGVVNFGTVVTGNPVVKTFTLSNTGTADLHLSNLDVPNGFTVLSGLGNPTVVAPGNSTTIQVRLDATTVGSYSGSLSFTTNDQDENPFNFTITGNVTAQPQPEIEVWDGAVLLVDGLSTVGFGSTTQGTPVNKTFTVRNIGSANLTLADLTVPAGFTVFSNFGSNTLTPGQSTTFVIRLTAASVNTFAGQLSFTNNDPDENPFNFTVNGTVTAAPEPEITVLEGITNIPHNGQVNYGSTAVGAPTNKTFTVRNDGTATLTLSGLTAPAGFHIVANFGSTSLAPNATTTFVVALSATSVGPVAGQISFANNDSNENPFNINVQGTVTAVPEPEIVVELNGVDIPDGTGSVNFGSTIIDNPIIRTLTVRNIGSANLTLSNLSVTGSGFSVATGLGNTTLVPGSQTTFQIRLNAAGLGNFIGTVQFDNNDADENPYNFAVSGSVTAAPEPSLSVEQDSTAVTNGGTVNFGSTFAGSPVERTFTVRNNGTAVLNLSGLNVVGSGFAISQNFASTTVAVGGSTTFVIRFNAPTVNAFNATVSFTSNDTAQTPFSFTVTGTATTPPTPKIEVADGAVAVSLNSTVQMGTTNPGTPLLKTFTIHNTGSQPLTVGTPTLPAGYTLLTTPAATVAAGASTTFQVQLNATSAGTFIGQVSIANNDPTTNPFTFTLTGVVGEDNPLIFLPFVAKN